MNDAERSARAKVARKMKLVRDPEGLNLPDELWMQGLPATTLVGMILRLRAECAQLAAVNGEWK